MDDDETGTRDLIGSTTCERCERPIREERGTVYKSQRCQCDACDLVGRCRCVVCCIQARKPK